MFRRRWSGLPDDPDFPADLEKLGYFVNEDDEIRSIQDPKYYFDYFHSKSMRHNDRQRFAFTIAVQDIIHKRLTSPPLSLSKLSLPLGTPATEPHTPIFVSSDLKLKKRIVVLFGEGVQDLGVLAQRVLGGKGGIDAGSVVGFFKALAKKGDVGLVLANTGESCWWPEGQRALSHRQSDGVRMKSAVMKGRYFDPLVHGIPCHGDMDEHVRTLFESVLGNADFVGEEAVIQVIGISAGAQAVEMFLDENWSAWKNRIVSMAILGIGMDQDGVKDEGFKTFLKEKARAYITCTTPLNTPMSNPGGNPFSHYHTTTGCPVLSSGEDFYSELTLIKAQSAVLTWLDDIYAADCGRAYKNPVLDVTFRSEEYEETPEFRDAPPFEGFPARLPPPPNTLKFMDETEPKEADDEEPKAEQGEHDAHEELGEVKKLIDGMVDVVDKVPKESDELDKMEKAETSKKMEAKAAAAPTEQLSELAKQRIEAKTNRNKVTQLLDEAKQYFNMFKKAQVKAKWLSDKLHQQREEVKDKAEVSQHLEFTTQLDEAEKGVAEFDGMIHDFFQQFEDLEKGLGYVSKQLVTQNLDATRDRSSVNDMSPENTHGDLADGCEIEMLSTKLLKEAELCLANSKHLSTVLDDHGDVLKQLETSMSQAALVEVLADRANFAQVNKQKSVQPKNEGQKMVHFTEDTAESVGGPDDGEGHRPRKAAAKVRKENDEKAFI